MSLLLPWLRETRDAIVRCVNPLLEGLTDGHIYSARDVAEFRPRDGMQHYYDAGIIGSAEGFYFREAGVWNRWALDTHGHAHADLTGIGVNDHHNQLHTIASHSDTTATGTQLNTLVGGGETTLHSHAAGAGAGTNPLDRQWYNPGDLGATAGTLNWDGSDYFEYRNFATGQDRIFGTTISVAPGWTSGDDIYVDIHWRANATPDPGDYWTCEVTIEGTTEGAPHEDWSQSASANLTVNATDEIEVDTFTITTANPAAFMSLQIKRTGTADAFSDNIQFLGARVYLALGAASLWARTSGVLHPGTITDDLAIGGTSSSAPFYVADDGELTLGAPLKRAVTALTGNTTLTAAHAMVTCDATSAAFTVTLPAASGEAGLQYVVKKIDASANAVTIDGNASETIDGATTQALSSQYDSLTIMCDGTEWWII